MYKNLSPYFTKANNKFNEMKGKAVDMFDDFHFPSIPYSKFQHLLAYPKVNISETNSEYQVVADLPGIKKEDIKLSIENETLIISGERKQEKEEEGKNWHRVESSYGSFERHINLSENIEEDFINASFKDGVLNVIIKKKTPAKSKNNAKQISIK